MSIKLKTLLAATLLSLMLTPAILMANEGEMADPCDNGQYADENNPCGTESSEYSEDNGSGDETLTPEEGQGNDEDAPEGETMVDTPPAD
jgi:hypothetical protein